MRRSITYLLIAWLVFFSACGYRTAPVPYDLPVANIETINQAKLNARGSNWVFRWKIPEGQLTNHPVGKDNPSPVDASGDTLPIKKNLISIFRLNIFKSTGECHLCKPESLGHFLIDLDNGKIKAVFPEEVIHPTKQRFFIAGKEGFRFDLPITFFRDNEFIERCFYTIDYFLASGLLSMPSQRLYPPDLKTVPQPKIQVRTSVSNSPQPEFFLVLHWDLQQEALRHTLQKDGKLSEQVVYYGVNFYSSLKIGPLDGKEVEKQGPFINSEQLINPEPLLYGSFSLLNFPGQLLARQVDRFGNESESITVFNRQRTILTPIEKNQ